MRTLSIPWRSLKTAPSCSISLAASPSPSRPQPQNLRLAAGCDGGADALSPALLALTAAPPNRLRPAVTCPAQIMLADMYGLGRGERSSFWQRSDTEVLMSLASLHGVVPRQDRSGKGGAALRSGT